MAASSDRPVYVFVGGVSHTPVFFTKLVAAMNASGYEASTVAYPTCGAHADNTRQWDEVTAIQEHTKLYLDERDMDVVLVMHSYGGWPGSRAVKGLDKDTRAKEGKRGIRELIFIAAFLLPDNAPMEKYSKLPPWLTVKNGYRIPNEAAAELLFSDLDDTSRKHWLDQFAWHRNDFTAATVPDAPWHLPLQKTYIITTGDKTATTAFQFMMLGGVIDETWCIKSLKAGHEPFLSRPEDLAKVILQPVF